MTTKFLMNGHHFIVKFQNLIRANKLNVPFHCTMGNMAKTISFMISIGILLSLSSGFSADLSTVNSWAIQLQNINIQQISRNSTIDLIVIDYSASGGPEAAFSPQQIAQIKNSGKIVLCYLSIGEAETYRWYWENSWDANHDGIPDGGAPHWLGPANPDWLDNYKVRYWEPGWQSIVFQYLDTIIAQGFDGIYMDIVDAYYYWGFMVDEIPDAASRMIAFIQAIRSYANLHVNHPFYIFAQNAEAVTDESDVSSAERAAFFSAIDGIGCEGLFFRGDNDENNPYDPDNYRLNLLDTRYQAHGELILSIEYLTRDRKIEKYLDVVKPHGYIPYVSTRPLDTLFDGIDIYQNNGTTLLAGNISYQDIQMPVPDVTLHLATEIDQSQNSQFDGSFQFEDIPVNSNVSLTAEKNGDIPGGTILSYDASLAARMAMGLMPNVSQAQQIAADADQNGTVQMYDAALISQYAVGLTTNSDSRIGQWAFFPQMRTYQNVSNDIVDANFQAIVIGDVDGNWSSGGNLGKQLSLNGDAFIEPINDQQFALYFVNNWNQSIYSCDLTLSFNESEIEFREATVIGDDNFTILANETSSGLVKVGCFGTQPIENAGKFLAIYFKKKSKNSSIPPAINVIKYYVNNVQLGTPLISAVKNQPSTQVSSYALLQNYPNPFNPSTTIAYVLPEAARVKLTIYNLIGEKINELVNEFQTPGLKTVEWNGCNQYNEPVSSGVYIYKLEAGEFRAIRKMTLNR